MILCIIKVCYTSRYYCGSARKFLSPEGEHIPSMAMTCQWNKTWTPDSEILPCDWVACLEPPRPPEYANLRVTNWFGAPIQFGDSVRFVCKRGMMFEEDPEIPFVEYTCQNGSLPGTDRGYFQIPAEDDWPRCVEGKYLVPTIVLFSNFLMHQAHFVFHHQRSLLKVFLTFPLQYMRFTVSMPVK